MATRRQRRVVALVLALGLVVPTALAVSRAVDDSSSAETAAQDAAEQRRVRLEAACDGATAQVARAVQQYVGQFDGLTGFEEQVPAVPDDAGLAEQFQGARTDLVRNGCQLGRVRSGLGRMLSDAGARGPLAAAVAATVTSTALRVLGAPQPDEQTVAPGDDLTSVVAGAAPGSTIKLSAGRFRLPGPLYVLRDVEIVGAGRGRTELVSSAAGAAILVPRSVDVSIIGLTVRHDGSRPASALVVWAGRVTARDVVLVGGRSTQQGGPALRGGGIGLVLADRARADVTDSVLQGNVVAGAVVGGRSALKARGVVFRDNGLCGLCVVGTGRAELDEAELSGSISGAYVAGRSVAVLRRTLVHGNREAGLAVQERARADVVDTVLRDNARFGIGVNGTGAVRLSGNTLADHDGADIVLDGGGRLVAEGNTCRSAIQLVVVEGTVPTLSDNRCAVRRQQSG